MRIRTYGVEIDGRQFNSVKEACDYMNVKDPSAFHRCIRKGKTTYKGKKFKVINPSDNQLSLQLTHEIKGKQMPNLEHMRQELSKQIIDVKPEDDTLKKIDFLEHTKSEVKNVKKKRNCPVICINLNKKFKTITAAAKYAKADSWTMSQKMDIAGQFIDSNGNIYKRLKPMNTKNIYKNTGDTLCKVVKRHKRNSAKNIIEPKSIEVQKPIETKIETKQQPVDKMGIVKSVLKEKMIDCINQDNFDKAQEIMNAMDVILK